jgi:hypothetical protein
VAVIAARNNCVRISIILGVVTRLPRPHAHGVAQGKTKATLQFLIGATASAVRFEPLMILTAMQRTGRGVNALGEKDVMVILDNHVSNPGWCCGNDDGNGVFGDRGTSTLTSGSTGWQAWPPSLPACSALSA